MREIRCVYCGNLHDIERIEPTLLRPDPILAVPQQKRGKWTREGKDDCVLRPRRSFLELFTRAAAPARYFLRVNMPFTVEGRDKPIAWGIWAELSPKDYATAYRLWDSPEQHLQPPMPARLANDIRGYPPTAGLAGKLQLRDPSTVPSFVLDDGAHPLIAQQRTGVTEEIVLEWLQPILHRDASAG